MIFLPSRFDLEPVQLGHRVFAGAFDFVDSCGGDLVVRRGLGNDRSGGEGDALLYLLFSDPSLAHQVVEVSDDLLLAETMSRF